MGRWEPGARGRLVEAAMELYTERGYEQTTVAEIARRAGVTERTFFRHFPDKREVLFAGSDFIKDEMLAGLEAAQPTARSVDAVHAAIDRFAEHLGDRDYSRRRQTIIDAHAELRERELMKMSAYASHLAAALQRRGADEVSSQLAAELGLAAFQMAWKRWLADRTNGTLREHVAEAFAQVKSVAAGAV